MKFNEFLNFRPKCNLCKIVLLLTVVVIFSGTDLIIKEIAERNLKGKSDIEVIPGFWKFHYVKNYDIGFSVLSWLENIITNPDHKWILLVCLQGSATVLVIIFYFYSRTLKLLIPLSLIISGALGNVIDRIIRKGVVDYVMWYYKDFVWPIFNLADVYTVCGALLLMIVIFFLSHDDKRINDNVILSQMTEEEKDHIINNLDENDVNHNISRVKNEKEPNQPMSDKKDIDKVDLS